MKITKGQYGYRDSNRKGRLLITSILIVAILAQLLARYFTDGQSAKNILTVMSILTVLPMANMASPLIASWRYRTPSLEFYNRVSVYEEKCPILYDLVITSKEAVMPMDAVAIHPCGVIAYCSKSKVDAAKAEYFLNEMLSAQKLDPHAKVIKEEAAFLRRLEGLKPASEYEDDKTAPHVEALVKSLSM